METEPYITIKLFNTDETEFELNFLQSSINYIVHNVINSSQFKNNLWTYNEIRTEL